MMYGLKSFVVTEIQPQGVRFKAALKSFTAKLVNSYLKATQSLSALPRAILALLQHSN